MFFVLSKIFWTLVQPLTFLALLFMSGLILNRQIWGKRLIYITAGLFIFFGFVPVGPLMVRYLENQTETPAQLPGNIDGIIVLGGAIDAESSHIRHQPQLSEWSERIFETIRLSRTYPQARVVYSGGSGSLMNQASKEAPLIQKMLSDLNFPIKNFIFESESRTTFENVVNSKVLVRPQAGENWLLITSAFHIPRSKAVFEKQGWKVIPYPAGFIENGDIGFDKFTDVSGNYRKLDVAIREIIGIIAYKLSGRI